MNQARRERLLTAEEFGELPDDGFWRELVRGKVVRMPPEFTLSSIIGTTIAVLVGSFVRQHNLGVCWGEAGGIVTRRGPDTVRAADFAFLRRERIPPGGIKRRQYAPVPDLAVEVVSATDRFADLVEKAEEYLAAGVVLVWVFDPDARAVGVFRPGQPARILRGDAVLDGEDVLPGFTLPLAEVWADLPDDEA